MTILHQHINQHIEAFISGYDPDFNSVFDKIQNSSKEDYRSLLIYINKVLLDAKGNESTALNTLHLHFEGNVEEKIKSVIGEFLIVRYFQIELEKETSETLNTELQTEIARITNEVNQSLFLPAEISKTKENKIRQQRKELRAKLKFFMALNAKATLLPKTLINFQSKTYNILAELFKSKSYAINLSEFSKVNSYVVLNTEHGINQLDNFKHLVDNLENIILFDCERKRDFLEYRYKLLLEWNAHSGTSFKHLLILTFNKDESNIKRLKTAINLVKDRFQIPLNDIYTITKDELTYLTKSKTEDTINVNLYGNSDSTFWQLFEMEVGMRDLYELRSIKMLNVYSLSLTKEIKQHILDDIFSEDKQSTFLSYDSRQTLLGSSSESIKAIRDALSNALELNITTNLVADIKKYIQVDSTIILPDEILKNDFIRNRIIYALGLSKKNKLVSWDSINFQTNKPILILAYRDQGRFQHYFYPNILESTFYNSRKVKALFPSMFFKSYYEWASYNLERDRYKYLIHTIRQEHFEFAKLEDKILSLKPSKPHTTNWDLENEFSDYESRIAVRVKFKNFKTRRTFTKSDLFIVNHRNAGSYRIERIEDLMTIDLKEETLNIQNLDEIQDKINIYEKLNTLNNSEKELDLIRHEFNISDKKAEKLWKILLQNKLIEKGRTESYAEVASFLKSKKLDIVSFSHFQNTWANPESDSITPISKNIFLALCEYLTIPKTYFIIMQRIKNASKQATRHSTRQMNSLLKDLFNDNCFDKNAKTNEILREKLDHYKKKHPLDEIGINENLLLDSLVILIELIQPEIKLFEVERIETVEQ